MRLKLVAGLNPWFSLCIEAVLLCNQQVSTVSGFTSSFIQGEVLTDDVSLYSQGISRSMFSSMPLLISEWKNEASSFDELVWHFFLQLFSQENLVASN